MIKRYNRLSLLYGAIGLLLLYAGPLISYALIPRKHYRLRGAALLFALLAGLALLHLGFVYYAKAKGLASKWPYAGWLSHLLLYFLPDKTLTPGERKIPAVPWSSRWLLYCSIFSIFLAHLGIALALIVIVLSSPQLLREYKTSNRPTQITLIVAITLSVSVVIGWSFALKALRM